MIVNGITQYTPPAQSVGVSQATTIEQARATAEVQAQIVVANNCPRNIQRAVAEMHESCGRMAMAEQAFYQVPNRGNGPSVHLMRELARIWGNIEHGSKELSRDDVRGSEIQAFAWDYQTNSRTSRTYIVPHERMKGRDREKLTNLGDITNNNNNVAARAVRECISNVLPRWFTDEAQNVCRQTLVNGEGKPLAERISGMLQAFKGIGVAESQIEVKLGKKRGQWDAGDVAQMGITFTSITRDGYDRDEVFPPVEGVTVEQIEGASRRGRSKAAAPKVESVGAVSAEQLAQLDSIRQMEKYDEGEWLAFMRDSAGVVAGSLSELTADDAAKVIAMFEGDGQPA